MSRFRVVTGGLHSGPIIPGLYAPPPLFFVVVIFSYSFDLPFPSFHFFFRVDFSFGFDLCLHSFVFIFVLFCIFLYFFLHLDLLWVILLSFPLSLTLFESFPFPSSAPSVLSELVAAACLSCCLFFVSAFPVWCCWSCPRRMVPIFHFILFSVG